jgi:hypothetical protein
LGERWVVNEGIYSEPHGTRRVYRVQWIIALAVKPQWVCTSGRKPWKSFVVISWPHTKGSVNVL